MRRILIPLLCILAVVSAKTYSNWGGAFSNIEVIGTAGMFRGIQSVQIAWLYNGGTSLGPGHWVSLKTDSVLCLGKFRVPCTTAVTKPTSDTLYTHFNTANSQFGYPVWRVVCGCLTDGPTTEDTVRLYGTDTLGNYQYETLACAPAETNYVSAKYWTGLYSVNSIAAGLANHGTDSLAVWAFPVYGSGGYASPGHGFVVKPCADTNNVLGVWRDTTQDSTTGAIVVNGWIPAYVTTTTARLSPGTWLCGSSNGIAIPIGATPARNCAVGIVCEFIDANVTAGLRKVYVKTGH